jgi:bifunctional DNA-binding transcriptional regulator/antitoxin component of YhaV-PrlF toxin-antitoxin module
VPRISTKNRVTIPAAGSKERGAAFGDQVAIEAVGDGEVRIRRDATAFDEAFGALTGLYPRELTIAV